MTASDADVALEEAGSRLATEVETALPLWIEGSVERIHVSWRGHLPTAVRDAARVAGLAAVAEVMPTLRALLASDVEAQWTNPLHLLRQAAKYPTEVLRSAGVPEIVRDEFSELNSPADLYGLEPAAFGDIDPRLHDLGLEWGAAKAMAHLSRRRPVRGDQGARRRGSSGQ